MSSKEKRIQNRILATEFVNRVNSITFCAKCGKQPIEWHRSEHELKPNSRVSSLRAQGSSISRIKREMNLCEPLCRACHMQEDGRAAALRLNAPYQKGKLYVPPKPCINCGKLAKPLRKGLCWKCSETMRCNGRFHISDGCCNPDNKYQDLD